MRYANRVLKIAPSILVCLVGASLPPSVLAAEAVTAPVAAPESLTAVLFAPSRPVMLRLNVLVDGEGLPQFREHFVAKWFQELDKNKDGLLDDSETSEISAADGKGDAATVFNWRTFDMTPSDSKLSPDEFRKYADAVLGSTIESVTAAQTADNAAGLFSLLDVDDDGALTSQELSKARELLAPLDADDDETISTVELSAAAKASASATQESAAAIASVLVILGERNPAESIAERILRQYRLNANVAETPSQAACVNCTEIGLSADDVRPFDGDANGKLESAELARMIAELPPRAVVNINLFDVTRGKPAMAIAALVPDAKLEIKAPAPDVSTVAIDAFQIGYKAERTRSSVADSGRYYTVRFRLVDKDKNTYLDAKEFPELKLPDATFEAVDTDGNKQIVESELVNFLAKAKAVRMNQVVMRVTDESQPLFKLLDTREDDRLSPRELNEAVNCMKTADGNNDGRITRAELTKKVAVDFTVKRPAEPRVTMAVRMAQQARSELAPRDSGPDWFMRMDRNYDGDVSPREFLGPRKVFDDLDADHDGLMSPQEAERAK